MYLSYNVIAVVNYIHDVKWTRISANHIQFNCTLACRSAIKRCVVELNTTKNMSVVINKEALSSWAIVDFFILDTHQSFTYTAFAEDSSENVLGQRINGNVPSVVRMVHTSYNFNVTRVYIPRNAHVLLLHACTFVCFYLLHHEYMRKHTSYVCTYTRFLHMHTRVTM